MRFPPTADTTVVAPDALATMVANFGVNAVVPL
jgi:hypothetical protein